MIEFINIDIYLNTIVVAAGIDVRQFDMLYYDNVKKFTNDEYETIRRDIMNEDSCNGLCMQLENGNIFVYIRKGHEREELYVIHELFHAVNKLLYQQEFTNYPKQIINFNCEPDGFHPTQKPVDLLRYLVLTYTDEGDTVLDNCSGSGTTAVACVKEKRHFICFEKDETYWKKSVERVKNEQRQLSLF